MDDAIILISQTKTQDSMGVWRMSETQRQVFCKVNSVSRAEFFDAGRSGLNPSFRVDVFHADYEGEELCKYNGQSYAIYRTYRKPNDDYIELYVERQGGANGKGNTN